MYLIDSPWFCWVSVDMEAKEEDEEEEKKEKKEKKVRRRRRRRRRTTKLDLRKKSFHYCHAWCRFVIASLGLAKGVPFVDLFSCFFNN